MLDAGRRKSFTEAEECQMSDEYGLFVVEKLMVI